MFTGNFFWKEGGRTKDKFGHFTHPFGETWQHWQRLQRGTFSTVEQILLPRILKTCRHLMRAWKKNRQAGLPHEPRHLRVCYASKMSALLLTKICCYFKCTIFITLVLCQLSTTWQPCRQGNLAHLKRRREQREKNSLGISHQRNFFAPLPTWMRKKKGEAKLSVSRATLSFP